MAISINTATAQVVAAMHIEAGDVVRLPGRPGNELGTVRLESVLDGRMVGRMTLMGVNHLGETVRWSMPAAASIYRA